MQLCIFVIFKSKKMYKAALCLPPYNLFYPSSSLITNAFLQDAFYYGFVQALKTVDTRENFLTIFKEISKDVCQKHNYKS